jgi:NAD(P)-dependent dehydrogenase (short-subunit alcohol dehydrogenase family)
MSSSNKKVCLIIGASRGIGRQVAVDLAKQGYYSKRTLHSSKKSQKSWTILTVDLTFLVVVSAKTTSDAASIPASSFPPDPNSSASTINTVAREITEAGGSALALPCDVRNVDAVTALVDDVVHRLGRLDVLIYNSGAIWWSAVETTPVKRFMLLQQVNPQGLYAAVSAALPYFAKVGWKGRIIVVSPPIYSRFFRGKTAYAIGKVGMSVLTKGLAMDFVRQGRKEMAITSIWPAVVSCACPSGPLR